MNNQIFKLLLVLGVSIFLFGVFVKLNAPLVEWDGTYISAAESVAKGEGIPLSCGGHPPLYVLFLAFCFNFFGLESFIARLANACALLLTSYIIWQTAKYLKGKSSGLLAAAVYLLSPVVIQGSTLMDIGGDTTLLPLGFALFMWLVIRGSQDLSSRLHILLITLTIAICFWLKMTSTLGLMLCVFLWFFLKHPGIHSNEARKIMLGSLLGTIIFFLSWISISLIFFDKGSSLEIFFATLSSLKTRLVTGSFFLRMAKFFLYNLRIIFWFSPFLLLLFLYTLRLIEKKHYGEKSQYLAFLWWISLFYFFGYSIIGGTNWGFPRYHAAILPFFAVLIGVLVEPLINRFSRRETSVFLGSIIGLSLIYVFVFDDPLLLLNLGIKEVMLFGNMGNFAIRFVVQGFLYFALPLFIVFLLRKTFLNKNFKDKAIIFLFAGIIISNVSLDIKQAKAGYITSYGYGAQGKKELVAFVMERINRGDTILATPEFIYEFRDKGVPYIPWSVWISTESVFKKLKESKPKVFILGLTTHTVSQLQEILNNSQINSILDEEYEMHNIGTYSVWIRK